MGPKDKQNWPNFTQLSQHWMHWPTTDPFYTFLQTLEPLLKVWMSGLASGQGFPLGDKKQKQKQPLWKSLASQIPKYKSRSHMSLYLLRHHLISEFQRWLTVTKAFILLLRIHSARLLNKTFSETFTFLIGLRIRALLYTLLAYLSSNSIKCNVACFSHQSNIKGKL